jgi:hypothetical protein
VTALIEVDLEGLSGFAGTLDRVRARLDAARHELRSADDVLGDRDVVEGLEHFEDHWRDGREKIGDGAKRLSAMVVSSVELYRELDADGASGLQDLW